MLIAVLVGVPGAFLKVFIYGRWHRITFMISEQTRIAIKGYLEGFLQGLVDEHKVGGSRSSQSHDQIARNGNLKPLHEAMLPEEIRRINAFERSFYTRLGSTFEYCGFYIAS